MPHKILLINDDPAQLEHHRQVLARLPSAPEVQTASGGARALTLLDAEPFHLLITDLKLSRMDGLQVISIVRRKHPGLRIVVLTALEDEQFRSRAYALGVDLYWQEPVHAREADHFLECVESLLGRQEASGFRGVQSKSLMDLIQMECLSQSSSLLRITHESKEGKIWVQHGELIDAATGQLTGQTAFKTILSWQTGGFEILPPDPKRTRTIHTSYQGLLLDSAQAQDEAGGGVGPAKEAARPPGVSTAARLGRVAEVESVILLPAATAAATAQPPETWGVENPERLVAWAQETVRDLETLGERLGAGAWLHLEALGSERHAALVPHSRGTLFVGLHRRLTLVEVRLRWKEVLGLWTS